MRRMLFVLIALVSFAAVGAASANSALALASGVPVATDLCAEPGHDAAIVFKPCGKMRNGVALPCHVDALPPPAPGFCLAAARPAHEPVIRTLSRPATLADRLFRPPRFFA